MAQNYGLGRGLASLIPPKKNTADFSSDVNKISKPQEDFNYFGPAKGVTAAVQINNQSASAQTEPSKKEGNFQEIDVAMIIPNPHQPRGKMDEEKLAELSESIREHGIIQPLIVSRNNNHFEIIAGERRFLAAKQAGLIVVPAIVRDASEQQKLELAIIENIQRHDLNPIEEALSFQKLSDEFDLTQEAISQKLGKSRSVVANKLRLLNLPVEIQKALMEEKITEGHAKAILALVNPEKQRALFEMILKNNLTVRQTEDKTKETTVRMHRRKIMIDPELKTAEDELCQKLGTKVRLAKSGNGGKIIIDYYSKEELNNLLKIIISKQI
jgi:ParB family transcriptional regulator, chromosome partitioning protein